jgi:lipoate-protein ligase A
MADVERELERDLELLEAVERGGPAHFRVWTTAGATVVIGRAVRVEEEVDEEFCAAAGLSIVRRPSGGRSVVVGAGTVQYSFALPYALADDLSSIGGAKRFCNALLVAGLERGTRLGRTSLVEDPSGDLLREGRKVAGLALRRRRSAMLLHGTILVNADLAVIARALKHPAREPAYRRGRSHEDFLANLGALDERAMEHTVKDSLARLG